MNAKKGFLVAPLLVLAGCAASPMPEVAPSQRLEARPGVLQTADDTDLCREWQRALDGYDVRERRLEIAEALRVQGKDPNLCAIRAGDPRDPRLGRLPERIRRSEVKRSQEQQTSASRSRGIKPAATGSVTCTTEVVKGPPERHKTVCR